MPTYHEAFRRHDQVLIANIDALDRICTDIGFCYLTDEQRAYASTIASVDDVQYWGDHVLHALKGLPGLWPEDCLDDAMFLNPDTWGWPKTLDYYSLESVARNRETYVVVKDRQGVECLAVRSTDARTLLANMAEVAAKLHIHNFTTRYQFEGTFVYREEH